MRALLNHLNAVALEVVRAGTVCIAGVNDSKASPSGFVRVMATGKAVKRVGFPRNLATIKALWCHFNAVLWSVLGWALKVVEEARGRERVWRKQLANQKADDKTEKHADGHLFHSSFLAGAVALAILICGAVWSHAVVPPFQTVNLAFDYTNAGTVTFYVRATNGPSVEVIGVTTNTTFIWTNVTPLSWRLGVTASNMWGESNPSTPLILPSAPQVPSNLRPVTTTFRFAPPAILERSTDLANWNERFRLFSPDSNGVQVVHQTVNPDSPFMFYRMRTVPNLTPPLP